MPDVLRLITSNSSLVCHPQASWRSGRVAPTKGVLFKRTSSVDVHTIGRVVMLTRLDRGGQRMGSVALSRRDREHRSSRRRSRTFALDQLETRTLLSDLDSRVTTCKPGSGRLSPASGPGDGLVLSEEPGWGPQDRFPGNRPPGRDPDTPDQLNSSIDLDPTATWRPVYGDRLGRGRGKLIMVDLSAGGAQLAHARHLMGLHPCPHSDGGDRDPDTTRLVRAWLAYLDHHGMQNRQEGAWAT